MTGWYTCQTVVQLSSGELEYTETCQEAESEALAEARGPHDCDFFKSEVSGQ